MTDNINTLNFHNSNLLYQKTNQYPQKDKQRNTLQKYPQTKQKKLGTPKTVKHKNINLTPKQKLAIGTTSVMENLYEMLGFSLGLLYLRKFVNGKILIGKIDKHFTSRIKDNDKLFNLAKKMRSDNGLADKVPFKIGPPGEAYFSNNSNGSRQEIVLGRDSLSAAFHELGHAIIENKTKFLKQFQNNRELDAQGAVWIYTLIESSKLINHKGQNNSKNIQENQNSKENSTGKKVFKFLQKYSELIPLVIYSPELVSEFGASNYGLKFLKKELKEGNIDKSLLKNIRNSYIAAFCTYLFIPVSLILMSTINRISHNKTFSKKQRIENTAASIGIGAAATAGAGGIMYAKKSITQNGDYTEEFLRKISNIPQDKYLSINEQNQYANSKYPLNTIEAMDSLKSAYKIGDLKFWSYTDKSKIIIEGMPYSDIIKNSEANLSDEIDKIYDRDNKKFFKPGEINQNYKKFRKDVKKSAHSMKLKSAKKAALTLGLSSAYISYLLGRLTMKQKKPKQIQNNSTLKKTPKK